MLKWHDPPNWDKHLDEAIEEVNALAPAAIGISACKSEPREPRPLADSPTLAAVCLVAAPAGFSAWLAAFARIVFTADLP